MHIAIIFHQTFDDDFTIKANEVLMSFIKGMNNIYLDEFNDDNLMINILIPLETRSSKLSEVDIDDCIYLSDFEKENLKMIGKNGCDIEISYE